MHPPETFVESLIDEELPPRHRAVSVEPLVARHLQFRTEVEGCMRVDQQKSLLVRRVGRRYSNSVRSFRFRERIGLGILGDAIAARVEQLEAVRVDGFYIAANAALGEAKSHPWLEPGDHSRFNVWVLREKVVQTVCPRGHQFLEPIRAAGEIRL